MLRLSRVYWSRGPSFLRNRYQNRVRSICGLQPGGGYESYQRWARVDASIAPLILKLNTAGLHTVYCCSGLRADHQDGEQVSGYIAFACRLPHSFRVLVRDYYEGGAQGYGTDCIRIKRRTEKQVAAAWAFVEQSFDRWSESR